jgi:hypothetical protein
VGIGTATPEAKLSLVGDETGVTPDGVPDTRRFLFLNNKSTGQYSTVFSQYQAGASNSNTTLSQHASGYYVSDLADYGQLWSTGKGLVLRASPVTANEPNTSVIKFMTGYSPTTGSNERMRISETGNIGIGTKNPEAKLTLTGDETGVTPDGVPDTRRFLYLKNNSTGQYSTVFSQFQAGASNSNTTISQHASGYYVSELADFGQLWSTGKGLVLRASPPTPNEPNISVIKFMTGYNAASGSNERMRIAETGNIGIGTTLPKAKLEVKDGDVYINDPTKGIILKSPNAACWRVTIDNTGNFIRTSISCPN